MKKLYGKTMGEIDNMTNSELRDFLFSNGGARAEALIRDVVRWAEGRPGVYRLPDSDDDETEG